MALSNKFGWLVVATGNKSELSVGYATLYGDMAGGFALLKDVYKTDVFRLAAHLNEQAGRELSVVPAAAPDMRGRGSHTNDSCHMLLWVTHSEPVRCLARQLTCKDRHLDEGRTPSIHAGSCARRSPSSSCHSDSRSPGRPRTSSASTRR
jgi:NAD synthase